MKPSTAAKTLLLTSALYILASEASAAPPVSVAPQAQKPVSTSQPVMYDGLTGKLWGRNHDRSSKLILGGSVDAIPWILDVQHTQLVGNLGAAYHPGTGYDFGAYWSVPLTNKGDKAIHGVGVTMDRNIGHKFTPGVYVGGSKAVWDSGKPTTYYLDAGLRAKMGKGTGWLFEFGKRHGEIRISVGGYVNFP